MSKAPWNWFKSNGRGIPTTEVMAMSQYYEYLEHLTWTNSRGAVRSAMPYVKLKLNCTNNCLSSTTIWRISIITCSRHTFELTNQSLVPVHKLIHGGICSFTENLDNVFMLIFTDRGPSQMWANPVGEECHRWKMIVWQAEGYFSKAAFRVGSSTRCLSSNNSNSKVEGHHLTLLPLLWHMNHTIN